MYKNLCFLNSRGYKISSKVYLRIPRFLDNIIVGSLLGDLSVQKLSINSNSKLYFEQSIKNRIYIEHLYSLFEEYCGSKPRIKVTTLKSQPNKEYKKIAFNTLCLPCFNYYRDLFYKFDGVRYKKVVPSNISDLLTPIGLAYWIMDDGSKSSRSKGLTLCTDSFTYEEQVILKETLEYHFNLNCSIQKSGKYHRIYILDKSKDRLIELVEPHILSHFHYKLGI